MPALVQSSICVGLRVASGVHEGAAFLMNGAEVGRTAKPVLPEEGPPKIRVPVSLKRSIDSLPSGTIFRVKSAAGASVLIAELRGNLALSVSRKESLVFRVLQPTSNMSGFGHASSLTR